MTHGITAENWTILMTFGSMVIKAVTGIYLVDEKYLTGSIKEARHERKAEKDL